MSTPHDAISRLAASARAHVELQARRRQAERDRLPDLFPPKHPGATVFAWAGHVAVTTYELQDHPQVVDRAAHWIANQLGEKLLPEIAAAGRPVMIRIQQEKQLDDHRRIINYRLVATEDTSSYEALEEACRILRRHGLAVIPAHQVGELSRVKQQLWEADTPAGLRKTAEALGYHVKRKRRKASRPREKEAHVDGAQP